MFHEVGQPHGLPFNPFKSCVIPRPIGWVTTQDAAGRVNLAPFSFFNAVASEPPLVVLGINGRHAVGGGDKDTLRNCRETSEFVVNMATHDLRDALNKTSAPLPPGENEFVHAGLTPAPSRLIAPPRVAESPVHLECRVHQIVDLPSDDPASGNTLVIGRVVGVHVADDALTADGRVDVEKIRPIARLGYQDYATVERVWQLTRPKGGGDAVAEGAGAAAGVPAAPR
ncbi:flavin reductase family protein [Caenispirillum bisanense]|uniref:NADH-FMN oxidoreductase RutF, flavin reductase (DIM6/NTAB) family n=1 Tax=Caenispirillum bisanense TaxID=414052 RepID=A0A286GA15_9PROT|nr:flavin reductase family protein [Caenispirillum bisanense]SOD92348.1 NADH-FMN oxidoreductase RutF, flavin reductase (DIM6/NTAB) family [Caenispirillum bisanense]